MRAVVIIPARLHSTRLPGKVLADIAGNPMIEHVYKQSKKAKKIDEVYIATDSQEIKEACQSFTDNIIMTDISHQSGTDRIAEAAEGIGGDIVVNVQGDEPLIDPNLIDAMVTIMEADSSVHMASAMHRIEDVSELISPDSVKVTVDTNSYALYFSRSIIPHHRDEWEALIKYHDKVPSGLNFYKHIGIYAYKKQFLKKISSMQMTYLERIEKLEQLRVLENGYKIKMVQTDYVPVGVDTMSDLKRVRNIFKGQKKHESLRQS